MLQQDDSVERSDATKRGRREIYPVAMDPPSMVRVFATDESVLEKKSIILFIDNIYTSIARQEPVENPKQSRARDFPHLPPNNTSSSAAAEASSPSLSRSTSAFSPARSAATRRWRREI
ncbi:uncharacterized protein G2W53_014857 [Senna tora]|uniref:Uncharacterized protein n=1 Tax=Senna tora TaxID=362788 RepID=A0A834WU57_9FABA|nr:uncharacterized protein G2W53_014857 [Senna tora]